MPLSDENKERIMKATEVAKTVVHYTWLPVIIYVGLTRSDPRPSFISLISPLA